MSACPLVALPRLLPWKKYAGPPACDFTAASKLLATWNRLPTLRQRLASDMRGQESAASRVSGLGRRHLGLQPSPQYDLRFGAILNDSFASELRHFQRLGPGNTRHPSRFWWALWVRGSCRRAQHGHIKKYLDMNDTAGIRSSVKNHIGESRELGFGTCNVVRELHSSEEEIPSSTCCMYGCMCIDTCMTCIQVHSTSIHLQISPYI